MHGKRTFRQRRTFLRNSEPTQLESPPERSCEREQGSQLSQPESELPQLYSDDIGPQTEIEGSSSGASKSMRVGRGVTVAAKTWGRNEPYGDVVYNEFGQICNKRANDFSTFIGTLSRKSEIVPLTTPDWRYIKPEAKDKIFKLCQEKFGMDDSRKSYVLKKVGDCWRKSKSKLRKRAFKAGTTVAQQVAARPEYIPREHWTTLCHYWQTPEAMAKSEVGKENRDDNIMPHTGGRKTIAQWREEMRLPDGTLLERADMFNFLRKRRSTGEPINEFARKALDDIESKKQSQPASSDRTVHRNDTLAQALGPDSQSHVRGLGGGVTPTSVFGSRRVTATQTTKAHVELLRERQLRETHQHQIEIQQQQIETQQGQIVTQQQQIEAQQQKFEAQEKKIESQDQQIADLKKAQDDMFEMFRQTRPQL